MESDWATASIGFIIEEDLTPPRSKILYPRDGDDLSRLPKIIGTASDEQGEIDFVKISLKNVSTNKWYTGTGFVADTETWLLADGKEQWTYFSPTWENGRKYTIRSRATDTSANEEKTAEVTFTYDTSNGEEGSVYLESNRISDETNYIVYFPVTIELNTGDQFEVTFNSGAYVFTGGLADADIDVVSSSGSITASSEIINSTWTTVISTITGSVAVGDIIEMHFNNSKVVNPNSTGIYDLEIKTYNSGSTLLESWIADVAISGQEVALDVQIQEALMISVDSGAVVFNVDPDVNFGQNWVGTGGAVSEKTSVTISTNNMSGYSLRIALSGKTATGSALLDGITDSSNQILTGDAKNTENLFGWALTGTASTVNAFGSITSSVATGISSASRIAEDQNDIYYYLNVNHLQESDNYQGTIVFTVIAGM